MVGYEADNDSTRTHIVLTTGTMVSHYRIVEKIGSGGMGEVYLAEDTKLNRHVALKFMPAHLAADDDLRARFAREAQAAAKLDHPNIVSIYEVSEYRGRPFIAMAHIKGESLRDVVRAGKLSISESIELAMQICEGLNEAHHAGVVHRDIKPGNIIVDSKGRARILDFGLATVSGEDKLTKTGSTLGTIGYMSPEQISGGKVDKRSDLFSVGVILYEMLTSRRPFTGDNDAAIIKAITDSTPEPIARFKSGITEELQSIVTKALAKDQSIRFQSADGMMADLKRVTLENSHEKRSRVGVWIAAGIAIIAVAYFGLKSFEDDSATEQSSGRMMLAVLPFENLGSPDDEYFADGITDEITSKVAVLDGLGVIARTSVLQYKGTTKRISEIGDELGVDYVLQGTIRWDKSGEVDKVRITPQLIGVSDETHLWADNYQRDLSEIFEVQEEIATSIAGALNVTLRAENKGAIDYRPTENLEAYDYYLRARNILSQGKDVDNLLAAIRLFKRATELDSTFAKAYAWKAYAHTVYSWYYELGVSEHTLPARRAYQKAFKLKPDLAEAYLARGTYINYIELDYHQALADLERAREGNVDEALVLSEKIIVNMRLGNWDEAIALYHQVTDIDPHSIAPALLGVWPLWYTHRYAEALDVLNRVIDLAPYESIPYWQKIMIQIDMGAGPEEIGRTLDAWSSHLSGNNILVGLGSVAYMGYFRFAPEFPGLKAELTRVKSKLNDNSSPIQFFYTGLLYRAMGESDSAYQYIDSMRILLDHHISDAKRDTTGTIEIVTLEHNVYELLALAYSLTDRHTEAIEQAYLAREAMPPDACHW